MTGGWSATGLGALAALLIAAGSVGAAPLELVVCAPGYPGSTQQAAPTMAAFASGVENAAGLPAGSLSAVYFETEAGGVERLAGSSLPNAAPAGAVAAEPGFALVPLPFFLKHEADLRMNPRLQVEALPGQPDAPGSGVAAFGRGETTEVWNLVAKKGRVSSPTALDGWEIAGLPGYSPAFVRGVALSGWGPLPATLSVSFSPRILTLLRRAASGESVAVLADRQQAAALKTLPFAADLEVVHRSLPVPGMILCTVGDGAAKPQAEAIVSTIATLDRSQAGMDLLAAMRIVRFVPLDAAALAAARKSFAAAAADLAAARKSFAAAPAESRSR